MRKTLLTITALTAIIGATSLVTTADAMPAAPVVLASATVDHALVQPVQYRRHYYHHHYYHHYYHRRY